MPKLETHPVEDEEGMDRWRHLAEVARVQSPFSQPEVARAIAGMTGTKAHMGFVSDRGEDRGAIVLYRRGRRIVYPALAYYTPLLLNSIPDESEIHKGKDDLTTLLRGLSEAQVRVHIQLPPVVKDPRPGIFSHLETRPFFTYEIHPGEHDISRWSESTRRSFRRHRDQYELVSDPSHVRHVVGLASAAYRRSDRRSPFDAESFSREAPPLLEKGIIETLVVRDAQQEVKGGVILLKHGPEVCYWIAGSEPGAAMTSLLGLMLERLAGDEVRRFDFLGANTPSIAEFKRRFGPSLTPFYHIRQKDPLPRRILQKLRRQ